MSARPLSESTEMYLKAIAELGAPDAVAVGRVAERLGVTPVSANEMVHRLDEQGWVKHTPYKGVVLTPAGQGVASNVLRRQRLWECFLYTHLHIAWAKTYELACALEHATAPEVTEALAAFLGHPSTCPRGQAIPAADGVIAPVQGAPLHQAAIGSTVRVLVITATATEVLTYLEARALLPGCVVTLVEAAPLQGPLTLRLHPTATQLASEVVLGLALAAYVLVQPMNEA